jgi:hypothetical protein
MGQKRDPRNTFTAMHHKATGELLHLMDGFYSNIEDGLFEFAYQNEDQESQQRACFDLMRELRYRRSNLMQAFAKRMQGGLDYWFGEKQEFDTEYDVHFDEMAQRMSQKCTAHFNILLSNITERTATATTRSVDSVSIPISPYQVAYNFLASCRSLDLDNQAIEIVQELFARFVLDRLGTIYGDCNRRLEAAGYDLVSNLEDGMASSA